MRGSVRRKHLAQEISTLVANQSVRAHMHGLMQKMDSLGVEVDASVTRGMESILTQKKLSNRANAREFRPSFEVTACQFLSDNFG